MARHKRLLLMMFYEHLGISCRIVDFSSLKQLYESGMLSGINMTQTPFALFDTKEKRMLMLETYGIMTREKMVELFIKQVGE